MANTYKNIVIVPNVGSAIADPKIIFSGANTTVNTDITLTVNPTSNGTISLDGNRQLFSVTNSMNGIIFSVNDVNGVPNIEVNDVGVIRLAQYSGNVMIGSGITSNSNTTGSIVVFGGMGVSGNVYAANIYASGIYNSSTGLPLSGGGGGTIGIINDIITNASYYPMLSISSNTGSALANSYTSNTQLTFNPSTGTLSSTSFNSLSDENKKTNIKIIDNALEITENLKGVTFDWVENGLPSAGLIAQDVEKYLPQLVANSSENVKSLNYDGIIGVLVEAVKDLSQRVKELEKK